MVKGTGKKGTVISARDMENFEFILDPSTRDMMVNGHQAISQLELWSWLRNYEPEEGRGFMFSSSSNLDRIIEKMESLPNAPGHSGYTMRHLHNAVASHLRTTIQHG